MNKNIRENAELRGSFFALAERVFGLSFAGWYAEGYWREKYIPYALTYGNDVVANASVNIIDMEWRHKPRRYIQIGTVMTAPEYRKRGFCRRLLETILKDWRKESDAIYLFANDGVLDFYPKFGFERAVQYQYTVELRHRRRIGETRKLDMSAAADVAILEEYYKKSNPYSAFTERDNFGLLMFYCSSFMKDCVYLSEDLGVVAVMGRESENLICYDIYGDGARPLLEALETFAGIEAKNVLLGFTPTDFISMEGVEVGGGDTLFMLKGKENLFCRNRISFPLLSHA
ncbi:GNAT family N-acetyltransferase [Cloacibacillus sp.]|uniref:GNAT family N-acetyltransferase n=1 Tax=Cloacibacillus sp. TaxID=2049023 RepID=UPI0025C1F5E1|nr:GNAT family N-acetyltransferase [Cloacibacillus sp.]MCC8056872.1 GNAT family N-acetyltransferase [Cloacibacillus sp.]